MSKLFLPLIVIPLGFIVALGIETSHHRTNVLATSECDCSMPAQEVISSNAQELVAPENTCPCPNGKCRCGYSIRKLTNKLSFWK